MNNNLYEYNISISYQKKNIELVNNIKKKILIFNKKINVKLFHVNDMDKSLISIYKKNIYNHDNSLLIVIDDYCILPFMILGKLKDSFVCLLEDDYSAKLCKMHNNANVICLPTEILGKDLIFNIIHNFLLTKFEGERHIARLDMLKKLLEKESI